MKLSETTMTSKLYTILILCFLFTPALVLAQMPDTGACEKADDKTCIINQIDNLATAIPEQRWRDKAWKELATAAAIEGDLDRAETIMNRIDNGDTRAMTIRAIGMALAAQQQRYDTRAYQAVFARLVRMAETITHDGARGIAYTYIAMSQAFAGMNDDATQTAKAMDNSALRNKAFGETAEIQAERGDIDAALASISHIDSLSFRNKAYGIIAGILMKEHSYDKALRAVQSIDNPTRRVEYLQKLLTRMQQDEATPLSQINTAPADKMEGR